MDRRDKLKKMLEKEPADVFLNYALAMELIKEGEATAAITQLDRVIAIDADYLGAYQQKAQILITQGRIPDARACIFDGIKVASRSGNRHAEEELRGLLASLGP
jgi:predicted Zn-dependent protease